MQSANASFNSIFETDTKTPERRTRLDEGFEGQQIQIVISEWLHSVCLSDRTSHGTSRVLVNPTVMDVASLTITGKLELMRSPD